MSRKELCHHGLNVEHWCAIERIEFCNVKLGAFHSDNATDRGADAIGAILATLRENSDDWPGGIVAWMAGAHDDRRRIQFVEVKQDFDVRELVQPLQRLGLELIGKGDARLGASPEVILHAGTSG